jgi:sugar O-acyltransferase (sialic acid O-acetyltransferase NeuD family)
VIIGYSGHSYVVIDSAAKSGIIIESYVDHSIASDNPYNLSYLGSENDIDFKYWGCNYSFIFGIGDNKIREKVFEIIKNRNENVKSIIDPSADISRTASISAGTFVSSGARINAMAKIGICSIINTGAIIEHECKIDDYVHIAPGAILAGNVKVGNRSFIGANSVIKEGITIGSDVIIGAGSVVIRDVSSGQVIAGNPSKNLS